MSVPAVGEGAAVEQGLSTSGRTSGATRRFGSNAFREIPFTVLGSRIFYCILGLALVLAVGVTVFAVTTYPTIADVRAFVGPDATGDELLRAWQDIRTAWVAQVTTIGQLFLFGSIIPLLATVVGYLLGERRSNTGEGS